MDLTDIDYLNCYHADLIGRFNEGLECLNNSTYLTPYFFSESEALEYIERLRKFIDNLK